MQQEADKNKEKHFQERLGSRIKQKKKRYAPERLARMDEMRKGQGKDKEKKEAKIKVVDLGRLAIRLQRKIPLLIHSR